MANTYYCNTCNADLNPHLHTRALHDGIEKNYLICPRCLGEFVAYYTDAEIRGLQVAINKVRGRLGSKHGNYDQTKLRRQYQSLKEQIGKRMKKLGERVEKEWSR